MRLMGVAAMPSAMNSVCAVWITRRMFCSRSSLRFTVCTSLRKVVYSMPCFHAVCNRKCAGWKHLCLARRGAAWYAHGRQRDSSPPERMSWPRRKSRPFFMTGFTGHKKRPDLIRGGPYPLELPRDALSVSLPHLSNGRDKPILTGFTGHKKDRIAFEAGLVPSSSLATLYPFPCRILTIDSKKSTLPKQRALYMVCVLAGWRRIRQPSSPWPALRVPCCPRRRGQWQG